MGALAQAVLPLATAACACAADVVRAIHASTAQDGLSLLHRAVRSGSLELVKGILVWGRTHGYQVGPAVCVQKLVCATANKRAGTACKQGPALTNLEKLTTTCVCVGGGARGGKAMLVGWGTHGTLRLISCMPAVKCRNLIETRSCT
jgi:hypothetical protein